jgi:hypothetical protein
MNTVELTFGLATVTYMSLCALFLLCDKLLGYIDSVNTLRQLEQLGGMDKFAFTLGIGPRGKRAHRAIKMENGRFALGSELNNMVACGTTEKGSLEKQQARGVIVCVKGVPADKLEHARESARRWFGADAECEVIYI